MRETSKAAAATAKAAKYLFMLTFVLVSVGPILWAFISSFKTYAEINSSALSWPSAFRPDNYIAAFRYAPIAQYFLNSVVIVGCSVLVTVALVAMCSYIISRFDFKLKTLIVLLISASLMLPAQAISQPLFAIFQKLGIFDTKLGMVIVYSAMGIPMSFFVMTSYYKTISMALEESAYIDGATFLQTFLHIILPLAKPGLVTIAMLQFINTWNEFYFALMLTSGNRARTVPIALNYYMGTFANNYSALFAAVVMTVLPTILVFILLQRQVMESLTAGAVKG
ncbi:MAG: carbohydrate ABC transporter permease [Kineothrix sp.]|jgi:raffinose/stachyose/melibiose transport system permease protein|nr:carbohydrate ABC transporter permease [Lachnospiraceae bacterium]MCX4342992.1 carbohydrate ABC transporter permease [Kineothrix sp.]